jgi:hypothetical protein
MTEASDQSTVHQRLIRLTPFKAGDGQTADQLSLPAFELIAYSQGMDHTRLQLTGRRTLEVKETTQEIDLLVRVAAR